MNCWICGKIADSGEHRVKASDLRALFPGTSQRRPIYAQGNHAGIKKVGSLKSDRLKWDSKICQSCNTTLTQPYDFAWEKLSSYLRKHNSDGSLKRIKLQKIFPGNVNQSMLNVHLFFAKVFGCLITEHNIPMPISVFSHALKNNKSCPSLYLGIGWLKCREQKGDALITPVQAADIESGTVFANFKYMLGPLFVDVIYSSQPQYVSVARDVWHPKTLGKILFLGTLRNNFHAVRQMNVPG